MSGVAVLGLVEHRGDDLAAVSFTEPHNHLDRAFGPWRRSGATPWPASSRRSGSAMMSSTARGAGSAS